MPSTTQRLFTGATTLFIFLLFCLCAEAQAEDESLAQLHSGDATLSVVESGIVVEREGKQLLHILDIIANDSSPIGMSVKEADKYHALVALDYPAAVDFHKQADDDEPRQMLVKITAVDGGFRFYSEPTWGRRTTLILSDQGDHYFGGSEGLQPDNQLSPDLRGRSVDIEVYSEGQQINENFASVFAALYFSSKGYAAFFDTFARGHYSFAINGLTRLHHDTGKLDWYIFTGDNGANLHRSYYRVTGAPKKIPPWALGPIGWRDQNNGGAQEVLADVKGLSQARMPFTAWLVDRPYSDGAHAWSEMNFNRAFRNPGRWIGRLRDEYGLELMTWTSTATFGDRRFEKHLPGSYSYIDLGHQDSVNEYQYTLKREQYQFGVRGHKIDRGDEGLALTRTGVGSTPLAQQRNTYVYEMLKLHDGALREAWGDDQFTFARAAIHRSQPYVSAIWGGDSRSTWEGFRSNFANATRNAFLGFPVWGSDVGGYLGEGFIPEALYLRWLQAGSMSGLFEIKFDGAGGKGRDRLPWRYDAALQDNFRRICEDRMQFLPYFYSLANRSEVLGSVMQPLAYRHLNDANTYSIWDQFYVGDILVAPVFSADNQRSVYFPPGQWKDIDSPLAVIEGGHRHDIVAPLEKLPRFLAANSLYITGQVYPGSTIYWQDEKGAETIQGDEEDATAKEASIKPTLTIHAYPAAEDAQTNFVYLDMLDNNKAKTFQLQSDKHAARLLIPAIDQALVLEFLLQKTPSAVLIDGEELPYTFDEARGRLRVEVQGGVPLQLDVRR